MKIIITSSILILALAISANAEDEGRPERERPRGGEGRAEGKEGRRGPHLAEADEMFRKMDTDGDKNISKEEFFAAPRLERLPEDKRDLLFERLDGNGDGMISRQEIFKMRNDAERKAVDGFRKLDADGSGGLNFEEFSEGEFFSKIPEQRRRLMFDRMDTDGSGEITAEDRPKGPPNKRPEKPGFKTEKRQGRD
ncbi:MAG: EF-hand domain-containing protein [Luteolibacter sp.]